MASKVKLITELYEETLNQISDNSKDWMSFLECCAMNYKYPFNDQVLIYAQKPDAVACAKIESWNKIGRWVNRGSKGIALLNENNGYIGLKYIFDLYDTSNRNGSIFKIWSIPNSFEDNIINVLERKYGELDDASSLSLTIKSVVDNIVDNNYDDLFNELNEYDITYDGYKKESFINIIKNSINFIIAKRCGFNPYEYLEEDDFSDITFFNNYDVINILGTHISDISKNCLLEIYSIVKDLQKSEINNIYTFDKKDGLNYDVGDRRNDYENELQSTGRLSNTELDDTKQNTSGGQVRNDEVGLLEEEQEVFLHQSTNEGTTSTTPNGNSTFSTTEDTRDSSRDEDKREYNRADETTRSDDVDRSNEQFESISRGDSNEENDFRLDAIPSFEQQLKSIDDNSKDQSILQLELFTPREKELADRIVTELNALDTKYKKTFYIDNIELKEWDHIKSNKRNLTINLKSTLIESMFGSKNSFTYYNEDKTDENILRNCTKTNEFLKYLSKDNDFSITIMPDSLTVYYHNFDYKQIDFSIGKDDILPNISNEIINTNFEKKKSNSYNIHPEITNSNRSQFRILDDNLGTGTPREKFNCNIEAIKVLKKCEKENRFATLEEQEILSKYVGWGGLSQAFDESDTSWNKEYNILKDILDEKEYSQARESTLTAFYTPPIVIRAMYKALENMGLKRGNILEPSCAVGNFIGMLPEALQDCKLYGVELDSISGRIAQQLYQKSSITVQGYEETNLPNSFFDVAVGNVPFGNYKVVDKKYDKYNFLIHDYFFAKTIDKVRNGGVIAFITFKGTLDKENPSVRKYLAQRTNLLGAIRLPNNTFEDNAGTKVTADIIFLQKRETLTDIEPDWVHLGVTEDGVKMNQYFVDHPEMIMGNMEKISTRYGYDYACISDASNLEEKLNKAILNINGEVKNYDIENIEEDNSIEADISIKNFSYTVINNKIYFRENSRMYLQDLPLNTENRIKGLIEIRDCVRTLLEYQNKDYPDEDIKREQARLNSLYDDFTKKYGLINSRGNNKAFSDDSSYYLLCSLEILDEDGKLLRKADMFTKRTIKPKIEIKSVDSSNDALIVSLSEKARVDITYMQKLCGKDMDVMLKELEGEIFNVPSYDDSNIWVTADEYLSGNVREKLKIAEEFSEIDDRFKVNVQYLKEVQPEYLNASEINVRLGTTWIPIEYYKDFIDELLAPNEYVKKVVKVRYMESTSEWFIEKKNYDSQNVKVNNTYGTRRANAYKIIEDTLNLRDVRIYDYKEDKDGKKIAELNKKETAIAQAKQEQIKLAFEEWIWKDPTRREKLTTIYNEKFNCIRPREYDGSHITFEGMNPEIKLRKHQINAIARILYGGNTLLAHEVGAGKTYEMVAAAMESKRLGLCTKSLFVVPNHIVEQFGQEFLQLYPSANILVTTKKDFETSNRKKFCSRIATGDYDAIIISHSQFEKIPMSYERQEAIIRKQIDDVTFGIQDLKRSNGEKFSIKQMERTKKQLESKLAKLNDTSKKDDVITFEELGVDRIFVDEAHYFKNLFLYTKMRNVGGIAQTEAKKSSDLFMKCRYLDEITNGKGVIFATGTPISNSMVELYTMQRYLQFDELEKRNLGHFDSWASTFGETVTAIELSPEGTGYRAKTRFAKFFNLPELMAMFKEIADIQTSDMLNLPVPKANYHNIVIQPSEIQKELVKDLSNRAELVRDKKVNPAMDNMLKITNDGRKIALDQRLFNDMLEDFDNSKLKVCANNVYDIWNKTSENKLAQLIFCDISTPHNDGKFNAYDDLKKKLVGLGIPENEIAFIHDANTDIKKQALFNKVRQGQVRVLMGSTQKMGAGTNCQDRLIALHDLDCPWRPSDLIQRSGRIIRQGNMNPEVDIYRYVIEGTFDAYLYQLVENKQRFISQIMTSKTPLRSAEDIDETALSYAEIKALAAGNPDIIEKTELDTEVAKLKLLKQTFLSEIYELEDKVIKYYPSEIKNVEYQIDYLEKDLSYLKDNNLINQLFKEMTIHNTIIADKEKAGNKLIELCKNMNLTDEIEVGEYKGFKMTLLYSKLAKEFELKLCRNAVHIVYLGNDGIGNITRIENELNRIESKIYDYNDKLNELKNNFELAKVEIKKPFSKEEELKQKSKRLEELNIKLNLNKRENEIVDDKCEEVEDSQVCKKDYIR